MVETVKICDTQTLWDYNNQSDVSLEDYSDMGGKSPKNGIRVNATLYGAAYGDWFSFTVLPSDFNWKEFFDEYGETSYVREAKISTGINEYTITRGLYYFKLAQQLGRKFPSFQRALERRGLADKDPRNDWRCCRDFNENKILSLWKKYQKKHHEEYPGLPPYFELVSENELRDVLQTALMSASPEHISTDIGEMTDDEIKVMYDFVFDTLYERCLGIIEREFDKQTWFDLEY